MICKNCGKMVLPQHGHIIEGAFYCDECTLKCDDCGEYFLKKDAIEVNEDTTICQICYEEDYFTCSDCGEIHHTNDSYWIEDVGKKVCSNCIEDYYECEACHKHFTRSGVYECYDEEHYVCESCYEYDYRTCDDCGRVMHCDDSYYNNIDDCDYCPYCDEKHSRSIYGYHDYEDFNKKQVYGETGTKEFFGLEIEVSGNPDYADNFLNLVPDVVLMHDGSIDRGFEIVTEPMTRGYIAEVFLPNIERGMKYLNDNGFRGHNRGGIHIHVSQEVFSKQMLCVLRNVLYSGIETNLEVWKAITQRHQSEIDQWCRYKEARSIGDILSDTREFPVVVFDRYTALNYDDRTGTYEFRIFNSNTRIERIRKNIQTVYSLVDYAKHKEETYNSANTGDYIEFVKKRSVFYPDLFAFMYEMGIIQRFEEERIAA